MRIASIIPSQCEISKYLSHYEHVIRILILSAPIVCNEVQFALGMMDLCTMHTSSVSGPCERNLVDIKLLLHLHLKT